MANWLPPLLCGLLLLDCVVANEFLGASATLPEEPLDLQLSRPCSTPISRLVRERLEAEVWGPAASEGLSIWPEGCAFDPGLDISGRAAKRVANKTLSEWDGVCLADYCEVFGVCRGEEKQPQPTLCDKDALAVAKQRCESVAAACFPPSGNQPVRRLHTRLYQQRCRLLDCRFQNEQHASTQKTSSLVMLAEMILIIFACILLFGGVVAGVELSGDGLAMHLADAGFLSQGLLRAVVRAREGLRESLGGARAKSF